MSTKIWTAWRFPVDRLREFQDTVKPQMFTAVIADVERLMATVKDEYVAEKLERRRGPNGFAFPVEDVERDIRCDAVLRLADRARDQYGAWMLTLDCGFNIWLHEGRCYVIPWGNPRYYEDLQVPEWAEDYHYQNSTDRPKSITEDEWDDRARTWNVVALDNWNAHRLAWNVVDLSTGGLGHAEISLHFLKQARSRQAAPAAPGQEGDGTC
jgi:hypothetical protein